jgi:uncharacterized membrane protein HdeD (DUF308 family)
MASDPLSGRVVLGIRSFLTLLLGLVGFFMVVLAALMPGTAAVLVVKLFAAYALLDGLLSIFAAARAVRRAAPRLLMMLEGLVDVATAVTAFILVQGDSPHGLLALIAAWAIITGALQLGWTFSIDIQRGRSLLAVAAALSLVFGLSLLGWRPPDLLSAVWRLAVYALLLGVLRLVVTMWLRGPRSMNPGAAGIARNG